jgi:hypothetical protein
MGFWLPLGAPLIRCAVASPAGGWGSRRRRGRSAGVAGVAG